MTLQEQKAVEKFTLDIADREKRVKEAINNMNFGIARAILEEPMPIMEFNITETEVVSTEVTILNTKKPKRTKKAIISNLDIPFSGQAFLDAWGRLLSTKEWRKKSVSQLQWNLNRLKDYPEEFAVILVDEAFNGGRNGTWNGVVFENTPAKYERWLSMSKAVTLSNNINFDNRAAKPSKSDIVKNEAVRAMNVIDSLYGIGGSDE